jgi:sugar phosphate isomerase/epimerase
VRARLGINTCFAVKRWPSPDDWAQKVRYDIGVDLVELSLDLMPDVGTPAQRARIADQTLGALTRHGLRAETTFTGLSAYCDNLLMSPDAERRRAALAWYLAVVDLTARLGAQGTGGHVGAMSVPDWSEPASRAERWSGLRADLAEISGRARESGLDYMLIENLASVREPSTIASVESLLTDGDAAHVPIRLCLDLGHQCVPGTTGADRDPYA